MVLSKKQIKNQKLVFTNFQTNQFEVLPKLRSLMRIFVRFSFETLVFSCHISVQCCNSYTNQNDWFLYEIQLWAKIG